MEIQEKILKASDQEIQKILEQTTDQNIRYFILDSLVVDKKLYILTNENIKNTLKKHELIYLSAFLTSNKKYKESLQILESIENIPKELEDKYLTLEIWNRLGLGDISILSSQKQRILYILKGRIYNIYLLIPRSFIDLVFYVSCITDQMDVAETILDLPLSSEEFILQKFIYDVLTAPNEEDTIKGMLSQKAFEISSPSSSFQLLMLILILKENMSGKKELLKEFIRCKLKEEYEVPLETNLEKIPPILKDYFNLKTDQKYYSYEVFKKIYWYQNYKNNQEYYFNLLKTPGVLKFLVTE